MPQTVRYKLLWDAALLNDLPAVVDLKKKFANIMKEYSPVKRPFYCHTTSVVVSGSGAYVTLKLC